MTDRSEKADKEAIASEPTLDRQIRAHFVAARQQIDTPDFESVMARAEAVDAVAAPSRLSGWMVQARWLSGAAVAAAAALTVLFAIQAGDQPGEERVVEEASLIAHQEQLQAAAAAQLLASVRSTTRWQAPSDRWLAVETDIDIFGLPEIGNPELLKEETTWL